jgi:hypothetical protein
MYQLKKAVFNLITEEYFDCSIAPVSKSDAAQIKKNFKFNWLKIATIPGAVIVKLTIAENNVIEGLMAFKYEVGFVECLYIERRDFKGAKVYDSIPKILMHYAIKMSFEKQNEGYVGFTAKTALIEYYEQLFGAKHVFNQRMEIGFVSAKKLLSLYHES